MNRGFGGNLAAQTEAARGIHGLTGAWRAVCEPLAESFLDRAWPNRSAIPLFAAPSRSGIGELDANIRELRQRCASKAFFGRGHRHTAMGAWTSVLLDLSSSVSQLLTILSHTGKVSRSPAALQDGLCETLRRSLTAGTAGSEQPVLGWLEEICVSAWAPNPDSLLACILNDSGRVHELLLARLDIAGNPPIDVWGYPLAEAHTESLARLVRAQTVAFTRPGSIHLILDLIPFLQDVDQQLGADDDAVGTLELLLLQELVELILHETTDMAPDIRKMVGLTCARSLGGDRLGVAVAAFFARWESESGEDWAAAVGVDATHETPGGNLWHAALADVMGKKRESAPRKEHLAATANHRLTPARSRSHKRHHAATTPPSAKTVLVVDDARLVRRQLTELVAKLGHGFAEAANGHEGLRVAEKTKPDLIILDLFMEEMNGFEMLRELRNHPQLQATPVVVLTVTDSALDREKAHRFGIVDYLVKPISSASLSGKISCFLEEA